MKHQRQQDPIHHRTSVESHSLKMFEKEKLLGAIPRWMRFWGGSLTGNPLLSLKHGARGRKADGEFQVLAQPARESRNEGLDRYPDDQALLLILMGNLLFLEDHFQEKEQSSWKV